MQREACKYLHDIKQACDSVQRYTAARTLEDYLADDLLRSAVERQFGIVGEALNQVLRLEPELRDRIAKARPFIAFRNVIIHQYAAVQHDVVWSVVCRDLPALLAEVSALLAPPPAEMEDEA
jgi:uncharacterized protein with HEPN domain